MAITQFTTRQLGASSVNRDDLDTTTTTKAVVVKLIAGTGITLSSTGVDAGTGDVTINASGGGGGTTTNALTMNDSGSGAATGTTFDGSVARTISYNTVGASPLIGSTSFTTAGTITTGTWNAGALTSTASLSGSANMSLINSIPTFGATVSTGSVFLAQPAIAASQTLTNLHQYDTQNISLGSGANTANHSGFHASSSMTSGVNIYGFSGDVTSGTNKWNVYMGGTASNYMLGQLQIGSTTNHSSEKLQVTGSTYLNGLITTQGTTASDVATLGSELLSTASGTNWAGSSLVSGGYTHTAGSAVALVSSTALTITTQYYLSVTIASMTAGLITVAGSGISLMTIGSNSTVTVSFTATATTAITITPSSTFDGVVTASLKAITASSASISLLNSAGTSKIELRPDSNSNNTFIGLLSGSKNYNGTTNTALGTGAFQNGATSSSNVAVGYQALAGVTTGVQNTSIGYSAGSTHNSSYNTLIGANAGASSLASANVGVGVSALSGISGSNNVGIGFTALTSGASSNNVGIGYASLNAAVGNDNVAVGKDSGHFISGGVTSLTVSSNSVFIGSGAYPLANSQTNQIVIGYNTVGTGSNTVTIGNSSITDNYFTGTINSGLQYITNTTAADAAVLGSEIMTTGSGTNWAGTSMALGYTHTTGSAVVLTSAVACLANTVYLVTWTVTGRTAGLFAINMGGTTYTSFQSASSNATFKTSSTAALTVTPDSTFDGTLVISVKPYTAAAAAITFKTNAGTASTEIRNITGGTNTIIGLRAGQWILSGSSITAIGVDAAGSTTGNTGLTAIGYQASMNTTSGSGTTSIGYQAGMNSGSTGSGTSGTFVGYQAGLNSNVNNNTFIGYRAGSSITIYGSNVAVGSSAIESVTQVQQSVAVGSQAGKYISGGVTLTSNILQSIYIGCNAYPLSATSFNEIVIGALAVGLGNNTTLIGTPGTTTLTKLIGQLQQTSIVSTLTKVDASGIFVAAVAGTDYQAVINGTGFVKATGTTISYDNSTYLTTSTAASTYSPIAGSASITTVGTLASGSIPYSLLTGTPSLASYITLTSLSSTATGLTYTNTTGVFSLTSGYAIPTTSSATNWDTAYTNRITSLTVTGSSGAATLVSNVLNIPTYTLAGLGGQASSTNLTSLAGLTYVSTSFVKMTAAGTFALDTATYLTANQSITLSGAVTGTGTTAITTTLANGIVGIANHSATGTPSATTFLRGDNTWATPAGGGGTTTNAVTFNNSGTGATSGTTFDGSVARTVSYNTIGALPTASPAYTGVLSTGTLSYTPTGHLVSLQSSVSTYNQSVIQNTNTGTTASSDMVVNNDQSTDTTYYGDFGINSSTFTGSGSFNLPNAIYLTATTGDLSIGTTTANSIHFVVNGGTTDALTISSTGAISTPNNISVNNVVEGFTSTPTAGATTTLTITSTQQQYFTGSLAQTVVLPVVSTLVNGFTYYIINKSTGSVTIQTSGLNNLVSLPTNTMAEVTVVDSTAGAGTASWMYDYASINSIGTSGVTEVEIDFGSKPLKSKKFTITAASATSISKILVNPSGNIATGRGSDDWLWDTIQFSALGASGSFTLYATSNTRIVGKRKIYYTIN